MAKIKDWKVGKDWAGYMGAAFAASGQKDKADALARIQAMAEKKRDRAAERERKLIWREGDTSYS